MAKFAAIPCKVPAVPSEVATSPTSRATSADWADHALAHSHVVRSVAIFFEIPPSADYKKVTSYMHIRSCYAALIHLYAILKVFALIKLTNFKTRFWTRDTCHLGSEDTTGKPLSSR